MVRRVRYLSPDGAYASSDDLIRQAHEELHLDERPAPDISPFAGPAMYPASVSYPESGPVSEPVDLGEVAEDISIQELAGLDPDVAVDEVPEFARHTPSRGPARRTSTAYPGPARDTTAGRAGDPADYPVPASPTRDREPPMTWTDPWSEQPGTTRRAASVVGRLVRTAVFLFIGLVALGIWFGEEVTDPEPTPVPVDSVPVDPVPDAPVPADPIPEGDTGLRRIGDVVAGDCIGPLDGGAIDLVEVVPCTSSGALAVLGSPVLAADQVYPGDDSSLTGAFSLCGSLIPIDEVAPDTIWSVQAVIPTREAWSAGERTVTCLYER